MQLYALDQQEKTVHANFADKQKNYFCLECHQIVRLRGGIHRQNHFYHLELSPSCRLSTKSMEHIQVQCYIQSKLPSDETALEKRFPEIGRIADVVWLTEKLIFEVQCSPIKAEEVINRNHDYQSIGYQVIWILHDTQFNKWRVSAAEFFLRDSPHYFTNIDKQGNGIIYDQFDILSQGTRIHVLDPLPVHIDSPIWVDKQNYQSEGISLFTLNRIHRWQVILKGDLTTNFLLPNSRIVSDVYKARILEIEGTIFNKNPKEPQITGLGWVKIFYNNLITRPLGLLFQMLLERLCR